MRIAGGLAAIRSGSWLTSERLRVYPAMLGGALALALIALVATSHGRLDHWDRPLGVDFSGVWTAGLEVRAGHPARPYDNAVHATAQGQAFGTSDSFLPWSYPPFLLFVAAALAGLPYLVALALWQGVTGMLYLAAMLRVTAGTALARRDVVVTALAFPAVAINVVHGQNGCLSAGLLTLGGVWLPRRPLLAGVMFGLMTYKPQFAIVVPITIAAGGHWRAAATMAATFAALVALSLVMFGLEPWHAFAQSMSFARHVILEGGGLESWKLQSAFAAVRLIGGSVTLAYCMQAVVTSIVLASLAALWHGRADARIKLAGLLIAALLATPYAVDYDLVLLGPAVAALAAVDLTLADGSPYARSLLAAAWVMPLVARITAMSMAIPLGFLVLCALYALVLRLARTGNRRASASAAHSKTRGYLSPAATVSSLPRC